MKARSIGSISLIAILLFTFCELALLFFTPRTETLQLIVLYGAMFAAFFVLYQELRSIRTAAFLAVGFRLIAWLAFPELSDDIYRFIWDGSVLLEGISPYSATPTTFFVQHLEQPFTALYPLLNSPSYFTVYPPIIQLFSAFGALIANDHYLASLVIKLPLLLAEIASIWMLPGLLLGLKISPKYSVLYMLNPLIIIDVLANAHFELLAIFFVLLTIKQFQLNRHYTAGTALAFAVATKLLPLIFFPFIWKAVPQKKRLRFVIAFSLACLLLLSPLLISNNLWGVFDSVRLYYQRFEFNASVYYLLRSIGTAMVGYNPIAFIGPALAVVQLIAFILIWWRQKAFDLRSAIESMLLVNTLYLLLATTVHPWYIAPVLALSVFCRKLYPLAWTGVVFLSYAAYRSETYHESMWLILFQYTILAIAMVYPHQIRRFIVQPLRRL